MKEMFFGAMTVLIIIIAGGIWSFNSNYRDDQYIKIKAETLAIPEAKIISDFCEENNFFQDSKYKCYLEGLTRYKSSANKKIVIRDYEARSKEAIKSNEEFQHQLPWIFAFIIIIIAVLIPVIMRSRIR